MTIEWDEVKARSNVEKHGVPFEPALDLDWSRSFVIRDERFDYGEDRFVAYTPIGDRPTICAGVRATIRNAARDQPAQGERARGAQI
jgi:uncharacterized protein